MGPGPRFLAAMQYGPLLLDGGMGTRLAARLGNPASLGIAVARANLTHPADVREIHSRDLRAGSDAIVTNSFGANRRALESCGFGSEFERLNRLAVDLARAAAGPERFVLGSIGPQTGDSYREQAEILLDAGVDAVMLETHTLDQALSALEVIADAANVVLVCLWTWPDDAPSAARRLEDAGAAAIGTNCGAGLEDVILATERIAGSVSVPLIAMPSTAGSRSLPDDFARAAPTFLALGVHLIGGCCGSEEMHVSAMRAAISRSPR